MNANSSANTGIKASSAYKSTATPIKVGKGKAVTLKSPVRERSMKGGR